MMMWVTFCVSVIVHISVCDGTLNRGDNETPLRPSQHDSGTNLGSVSQDHQNSSSDANSQGRLGDVEGIQSIVDLGNIGPQLLPPGALSNIGADLTPVGDRIDGTDAHSPNFSGNQESTLQHNTDSELGNNNNTSTLLNSQVTSTSATGIEIHTFLPQMTTESVDQIITESRAANPSMTIPVDLTLHSSTANAFGFRSTETSSGTRGRSSNLQNNEHKTLDPRDNETLLRNRTTTVMASTANRNQFLQEGIPDISHLQGALPSVVMSTTTTTHGSNIENAGASAFPVDQHQSPLNVSNGFSTAPTLDVNQNLTSGSLATVKPEDKSGDKLGNKSSTSSPGSFRGNFSQTVTPWGNITSDLNSTTEAPQVSPSPSVLNNSSFVESTNLMSILTNSAFIHSVTAPQRTTNGPVTTAPQRTTHGPVTTAPQRTTHGPVTTAPQRTTHGPVTTAPQRTTHGPVTTAPQRTTHGPVTTAPQRTTHGPVTTAPQRTTHGPVTTAPRRTTHGPVTTAPQRTILGSATTAPQRTTNGPVTRAPQRTTHEPVTTAPRRTTHGPVTTTPQRTTHEPVTTAPQRTIFGSVTASHRTASIPAMTAPQSSTHVQVTRTPQPPAQETVPTELNHSVLTVVNTTTLVTDNIAGFSEVTTRNESKSTLPKDRTTVLTIAPTTTVPKASETTVSSTVSVRPIAATSAPHMNNSETSPSNHTPQYTTLPFPDLEPPLYIRLSLQMSWKDFCESQHHFLRELVEIIEVQAGHVIRTEQVIFLDGEMFVCKNIPAEEEEDILIRLYISDEEGRYNSFLTMETAEVMPIGFRSSTRFRNKVREVRLVGRRPTEATPSVETKEPGIIIAIVIASIGGVCCVVLVLLQLVLRHRHSRKMNTFVPGKSRCSTRSSDSIALNMVKVRPHSGLYNPALDTEDMIAHSHPVNFAGLANLSADVEPLYEQFQLLPNETPSLSDVPIGCEEKNRYSNVLPFSETRVRLTRIARDDTSDYINANYITGYQERSRAYIATQAPLKSTVVDFWRMVWEQQSRVIVMLTPLEEHGLSKCSEYWPNTEGVDTKRLYGDYQVELKKKEILPEFIISTLVLKNMDLNLTRQLTHLWFTNWPQDKNPDPVTLVKFIKQMRTVSDQNIAPVVVHCSPGTGRTGSLIAIDTCMRMFDDTDKADILQCVSQMRRERAGVVQTREQYALIYKSLNEYAIKVNNPPAPSSISSSHESLQSTEIQLE